MPRRHPVGRLIGRHFGSFGESPRKSPTAVVLGLLAGGRLGLAAIARGMTSSAREALR